MKTTDNFSANHNGEQNDPPFTNFVKHNNKPAILVFLIVDGSESFARFHDLLQKQINDLIKNMQKEYRVSGRDIFLTVLQFRDEQDSKRCEKDSEFCLKGKFVDPKEEIRVELPKCGGTTDVGGAIKRVLALRESQSYFLRSQEIPTFSSLFFLFSDLISTCGDRDRTEENRVLQETFEQVAEQVRRMEENHHIVFVTSHYIDSAWSEHDQKVARDNLMRISPEFNVPIEVNGKETEDEANNIKLIRFFGKLVLDLSSSSDPREEVESVFRDGWSET